MRRKMFLQLAAVLLMYSGKGIAQRNGVCTLSDERMDRATKTFAKIANVLRNPRCSNCHGGTRPFSPDTEHAGGTYDVKTDKYGNATPAMWEPCQQCHGAFPGWQVPTEEMSFVGKDDAELCKTLKENLGSGSSVVNHFTNDSGNLQFIEEGFRGTRGLNAFGRSLVDDYKPEPIHGMTQAQLLSLVKEWLSDLNALGSHVIIGRWSDSDCGCVKHHYSLKLHSHVDVNMQGFHYSTGPTSDPVIPLSFDDDGPFHGQPSQVATAGVGGGGPCNIQASGSGQLVLKGEVTGDARSGAEMKVNVSVAMAAGTGSANCPGVGTFSGSGKGPAGSGNVQLEPFVGARSETTPSVSGVPGEGGDAWIEIIQTD